MLKTLKMLVGHVVALPLLVSGGVVGVFGATILRDVLLRTPGMQTKGLVIAGLVCGVAAVGVGTGGRLLYRLWGGQRTAKGARDKGEVSLHQLRKEDQVDYNVRTWEVTEHKMLPYEGWPSDIWTLKHDGEERILEYEPDDGGTFRLYEPVPVSEVTVAGEPVVDTVGTRGELEPPPKVEYGETGSATYVLAEEDARVHEETQTRPGADDHINVLTRSPENGLIYGGFAGIGRHIDISPWLLRAGFVVGTIGIAIGIGTQVGALVGLDVLVALIVGYFVGLWLFVPVPLPEQLSHYWVYEDGEDGVVALQRADDTWTAYAGREVEPYEFNNILPAEWT